MATHTTPVSSSAATHPARSSRWVWMLVLVLIVAGGVGGAYWWTHGREAKAAPRKETDAARENASAATEAVRVEVVHPQKGGIVKTSTQIGSVHAFESADLYAKVSGYLKKQTVDFGSRVQAGEVLAEIDDPEVIKEAERAAAELEHANAKVAQANARVETAKSEMQASKAAIAQAEADVASSTSRRKYREKELARFQGLFSRGAVPQSVIEEEEEHLEGAKATERSSQAAVLTAQANFEASKAKVDQAKADLFEAQANVEVDKALLAKANVLVDYTKIVSPYTGVVTLRNFFPGDFIRSAAAGGDRPVLRVARTDKVRVVTFVPDRDVPYTDVGDKAIVTLDALPGQKFEGRVSRFADSEEVQSRTMHTEIDLPNPDGKLREGMYGLAMIILQQDSTNLTVPTSSLTGKSEGGTASVFVVRDGKAKLVPVSVGADDGIRVEILKGLTADDLVITSKNLVVDGTPVTVAEAPKAEGSVARSE